MDVFWLQEVSRADLTCMVQPVNEEIAPAHKSPHDRRNDHQPKCNASLEIVVDEGMIQDQAKSLQDCADEDLKEAKSEICRDILVGFRDAVFINSLL